MMICGPIYMVIDFAPSEHGPHSTLEREMADLCLNIRVRD
jgi:hypothetical protein